MIICAAIKLIMNNLASTTHVVCGRRHCDCFATIREMKDVWKGARAVQGFIDHNGNFLNRKDALAHARDCGQLPETVRYYQEDHNIYELYSEDLY